MSCNYHPTRSELQIFYSASPQTVKALVHVADPKQYTIKHLDTRLSRLSKLEKKKFNWVHKEGNSGHFN